MVRANCLIITTCWSWRVYVFVCLSVTADQWSTPLLADVVLAEKNECLPTTGQIRPGQRWSDGYDYHYRPVPTLVCTGSLAAHCPDPRGTPSRAPRNRGTSTWCPVLTAIPTRTTASACAQVGKYIAINRILPEFDLCSYLMAIIAGNLLAYFVFYIRTFLTKEHCLAFCAC